MFPPLNGPCVLRDVEHNPIARIISRSSSLVNNILPLESHSTGEFCCLRIRLESISRVPRTQPDGSVQISLLKVSQILSEGMLLGAYAGPCKHQDIPFAHFLLKRSIIVKILRVRFFLGHRWNV